MNKLIQIRKYLGITQRQLADILMIKQNAVSLIENEKVALSERNRQALIDKLGVSPRWLEGGEGEIFVGRSYSAPPEGFTEKQLEIVERGSGGNGSSVVSSRGVGRIEEGGVPYYDKPVTGSLLDSFDDMGHLEAEYMINIEPLNNCTFYRPLYGESMVPKYNPGDILAFQRVHDKRLIMYGEAYLCMIKSGADYYETVKILRKNNNPSMITLRSVNPNFDDTSVPLDCVLQLYLVRGKIERNF